MGKKLWCVDLSCYDYSNAQYIEGAGTFEKVITMTDAEILEKFGVTEAQLDAWEEDAPPQDVITVSIAAAANTVTIFLFISSFSFSFF